MFLREAAVATAWLLVGQTAAQGIGKAETHPKLTTAKCTIKDGCVAQNTSVVLDASFHGLRQANGTDSCGGYGAGLSKELCPDHEACARNCVFDGADYAANGVATDGAALTLNMYTRQDGGNATARSPRVYLLDEDGEDYEVLLLKNAEISFDVDVSKLVCGMNGALYVTEMNATGARSALNPAGARYGTGYCDAQCPMLPFINGVANIDARGSCCNEMDIWEANSLASAFTAHPCGNPGVFECKGAQCGSLGVCEKSGCEYNTWKLGNTSYYGPSSPGSSDGNGNGAKFTVDTTRPFTVTTQFLTSDNPSPISFGTLNEVRRLYVQDGVVIDNAYVTDPRMPPGDSLRMSHCQASGALFENLGGLATTGHALDRGMVLAFSLWNDGKQFMNWLDAGRAGPCSLLEGDPEVIKRQSPGTSVTFRNVRWGEIGSTYGNGTMAR
ncbi:glycoside hydrolase family 7 protein [Annulohypoxylon bovei var. microspora]|nr:glycoside hydrolase family 7 protein [Annulohypoxylon bovei var. microspora]